MLTEQQKNCKHEWYSKLHPHQFRKGIDHDFCSKEDCVVYRRDWEDYQQGLDDRVDEAIKLCDDKIKEIIKHRSKCSNWQSGIQGYVLDCRDCHYNTLGSVLEPLKSALLKLKTETLKSGDKNC